MRAIQAFLSDFAAGARAWAGAASDTATLSKPLHALPLPLRAGFGPASPAASLQNDAQWGEGQRPLTPQRSPQQTPQEPAEARQQQGVRLQLQGLQKSFGEREVLRPMDLVVEPGEFIAIVGRSGCGKSTLLRLVAGLETPSGGQLSLDQQAVKGIDADTRIMFQDARLLPWKSVLANVALGLPKSQQQHALQVLAQVGLADRAKDWPANLSGGQRQRVALARALVHQPKLLLLDESLGALDALTRIEMHALIARLWSQLGFTALLVTHDVQEAIALADRVVLIEDGAIALDERIALPHPRQRGSAAFAEIEARLLDRLLARPAADAAAPVPLSPTPVRWQWAI